MKLEQHRPVYTMVRAPHWTQSEADADVARDEALLKPRKRWPDTDQLAEQPGLLWRLDAMLHA